jgi:DNA-binding response OmpR family regulator
MACLCGPDKAGRSGGLEVEQKSVKRAGFPVLILNVHNTVENRIEGLYLGADDAVVKPFDVGHIPSIQIILRNLIDNAIGYTL